MKDSSGSSISAFVTSDTALAAWLVSRGFELQNLDNSRPNSVAFLFADSNDELVKAVKIFQLGTAEGNILAFYRAYKRLVSQIKESVT
jgi:hypothetical protein